MPYSFGARSSSNLNTCVLPIKVTLSSAILVYDFSVITGHRNEITQNRAFTKGYSTVQWPNSEHNVFPSNAADLYPWHKRFKSLTGHPDQIAFIAKALKVTLKEADWFIRAEYHRMAGTVIMAGNFHGVDIRWGGDWDGDGDTTDQSFDDLCHFETR